ncbi:MAG TPA: penicillin-binding protein [Cytophagales bacterium]|nr:penicillin-binding protein [Cytophagales bacterium]HAA17308.1 penicillin-binding protein [Cytophagales bacterium]HAP62970.1 penicillin-binding protein [Cytophagales bacterium]
MKARPRSLLDIIKQLVIMGVVVAALVLLFFFVYLPATTNHGESITVPDLVGMPIDEIEDFLSRRDLRFEVLPDSGFSEDYPPLTVLLQEPRAESQVKEGRKIYLTVNVLNPPLVRMPDLTLGSSYDNAKLLLKSQGLRVGNISYRADAAEGTVLEQWYKGKEISANTLVPKGAAIDLVLADGYGDRDFPMPLLKGLSMEEAMFQIDGNELALGGVTYVPDTAGLPGIVVDQFPDPGNGVKVGDEVRIMIYEGDAEFDDPLLDSLNQTLN